MKQAESIQKAPEKRVGELYDEMIIEFGKSEALASFIWHAAGGSPFEIETEELGIMAGMLVEHLQTAKTMAREIYARTEGHQGGSL
jgi:hypothetical protein